MKRALIMGIAPGRKSFLAEPTAPFPLLLLFHFSLEAKYFVGCGVIRTVIVGARSAPYDSVGKAGTGANSDRGWLYVAEKFLLS